jgi:tetratricopeptide (TPR) repeat protein
MRRTFCGLLQISYCSIFWCTFKQVMSNINSNIYTVILVCVAMLTAGCATTGENPSIRSINDSDQLLLQAREALSSGAKLRAQKLLEDATKTNPADKKPWLKLAQLQFEQGNYAQAVTAGQEVLARDTRDQEAHSIVLVSSLRIAAKSLAEMSQLNQLSGDARTEAKKVAAILRENLGEEVLVPEIKADKDKKDVEDLKAAEAKKNTRSARKNRASPRVNKESSAQPIVTSAPSTNSSGGGRSDPFGSLR